MLFNDRAQAQPNDIIGSADNQLRAPSDRLPLLTI
jgi:hypothetical protein